ncbi:LysE family translocator [bacterium]|nr:LysE family translocator [bacterium]
MDALLTLPQFAAFFVAAALVALAPGPDNLMVLSLGMARGRTPGVAFALGCALGCLNHTLLAALGISALIAASPLAFGALKIAGGLYLLWLGIQALRNARASSALPSGATPSESAVRLFAKGLVANAINPKVILFFLAFLPQFVDGARGHPGWQIAQLGLVFTVVSALVFAAIGWFAGAIGERLARNPTLGAWLDRVAGGTFVALGAKLLVGR